MVQEEIQNKIKQSKEQAGLLEAPEAKEIFDEMCGLFDKLVMLTRRYNNKEC